MLLMNRLEFSCFADLLLWILKPEKRMVFSKICQYKELWIAWRKYSSLLLSWRPRIPSLDRMFGSVPKHWFVNDNIMSFCSIYHTCDADGPDRIVECQAGKKCISYKISYKKKNCCGYRVMTRCSYSIQYVKQNTKMLHKICIPKDLFSDVAVPFQGKW